ncbi:MAG TPA: exodeoxyribonuclease VII small subunit [Methanocorpusculum sp.]|nr:exodeoxyribonuclease VII small subunit [Methanocorpusculum sp.]HJJ89987.1 exodeoxyribonuclease VII small subunit [Methanocorpusculum sp.]HJJ90659.1 exodeoxyribonuclease VII small subunit [Methanocorpusculum sp.]HJK00728.1 exodeoxyribonuclease VII small subunit [Methanocorpusculum sp.]
MTEKPNTQTYESMITKLKEIAKQLDDPDTPIEEAVRLHQEGLALIRNCEEFLQKAELTITEVQPEE